MLGRRIMLFVGLLVLVAAVMSACGPGGGSAAASFSVSGSEFEYKPPELTVKPGQQVTINFKNTGTVQHTFIVKDANNFKLVADPGQTVNGTFTAPTAPGTYQIHCDVAGHTEAGMVGKLIVQ
jgi:plastocyanin